MIQKQILSIYWEILKEIKILRDYGLKEEL